MDLNKLFRTQWDRTSAAILSLIGVIFLIVGYVGVSGTPYLAGQAPYIISGGIGGVFFLGYGATLWISADLRDEWRKLDRIEEALKNGQLRWTEADEDVAASIPAQHFATAPAQAYTPAPEFSPSSNGFVTEIDLLSDTTEIAPVRATRAPGTRRTTSANRSRVSRDTVRGA